MDNELQEAIVNWVENKEPEEFNFRLEEINNILTQFDDIVDKRAENAFIDGFNAKKALLNKGDDFLLVPDENPKQTRCPECGGVLSYEQRCGKLIRRKSIFHVKCRICEKWYHLNRDHELIEYVPTAEEIPN